MLVRIAFLEFNEIHIVTLMNHANVNKKISKKIAYGVFRLQLVLAC
jgi:hypothetical protein